MIQRPNISHFKGFDITSWQYEIRVPQKKSIGEPQYTTGLGMIFYGTDGRLSFFRFPTFLLTKFLREGESVRQKSTYLSKLSFISHP